MKINLPSTLKLGIGNFFLLLWISSAIGGPPLQGEIPIGFYSPEDGYLEKAPISPANKQEETYRLPLSVRPIHYDLEIRPILDSGEPDQFTAPGKVVIRVKCFEATNSITIHSKDIDIKQDEITVVGIAPVGETLVTGVTIDEPRSFYIIHLDSNLIPDAEYLLTIPFTSKIPKPDVSMAGLYASSYMAGDGSTKYLATTQFQKADASRAFPCFDEPSQAFRASFNVKIGRKAEGYHSLANMERVGEPVPIPGLDGWVWDSHNTTVNMPPYLLAIIVSDFESETAPEELYAKPVRTWAAPPLMTESSGKASAKFAANILAFFESYFDYPYQLSKMDSVAIPDFAAGAMENWGLNTYRTNLMVWFEEENTIFERWRSAAVIAHELAHQWFGNLVTCEWWNDTWLNEGFARYLQFIAANHSGENFRSLDRYVIDVTQLAMANDVLSSTEPVHSNVTDRIVNQNSRIVYEKAAGLIRMMQSFLTEETLIKGLRSYLKRHQYGGVVQDDLFLALTEQAEADGTFTRYTVKEVMDSWTLQSGFPIIRVSRIDSTRLYISQEKFRLTPLAGETNEESLWYVPISYVTASNPDFTSRNLAPKDWMDKDQLIQSLIVDSTERWVIINPDARSFYRVIYDDAMTKLIVDQLEADHKVISLGSRSQLIDDYFKSADAKYVNIQYALNLTRYLQKEDDFIVWTTVFNNLLPISTRLADTPAFANFKAHILNIVIEPLTRIDPKQKPSDPADVAILRTQLLDWACSMSHSICGETAEELFAQWQAGSPDDKIPIPADIQPMLYCGAVAASIDPTNTTIQDFLVVEYVKNRGARQQTLIVNGLACDQVEQNLQKLMDRTIDTNDALRLHGQALLERIAGNSAGRLPLMRFINSQNATIATIYGPMAVPTIISRFMPYLSSKSESTLLNEVTTFINQYLAQQDIPQQVRTSLEGSLRTLAENSAWMAYYYNDISSWLTPPPPLS